MAHNESFEKEIAGLVRQEEELQFDSFTNQQALEIGILIQEQAKKTGKKITIDIERNGQQLFHYAMEGTSPDNDQWIIRKKNTVRRFNKSSYHLGMILKNAGQTLEEKFAVDTKEYSHFGGSFPVRLKNTGVIGSITVSGLPQKEDHEFVVSMITEYLKRG
jgi:uncharacterized protein (UPF0303 family)